MCGEYFKWESISLVVWDPINIVKIYLFYFDVVLYVYVRLWLLQAEVSPWLLHFLLENVDYVDRWFLAKIMILSDICVSIFSNRWRLIILGRSRTCITIKSFNTLSTALIPLAQELLGSVRPRDICSHFYTAYGPTNRRYH